MDKKGNSVDSREYTIKIIPHQGSDVHSIHLPILWIKVAAASVFTVLLLLAGAFSYSVYSSYSLRNEASQIEKLREANSQQQEQLLELSKKANDLQNEIEQLGQVEKEVRQLSGIADEVPVDNSDDVKHDGQGGPIKKLAVQDVSFALDDVEQRVNNRRASLLKLRDMLREQHKIVSYQESAAAATPSIWPASGDVSSPYGLRWNGSDFHPGIDIANDIGTPIMAAADGVVTVAGWNSGGYGNMVDIDHGNGIMTRYGHAQQVVVSAGQTVKKGQIIAYMGSTGYSTGPHLHYEVRVNGQAVNPAAYMR
ncbi:MAG: peptidoglycan DD-metalloendopeptidase family protein [Anaerovibrio sp.]|uniref:M23 family metallopeptidase n=1 Tax=Anaerovibrio sp. TaxID=1872532 RepID=UPI0026008BA0|nr:M23 family metallopeptidase [Anaerovibrio sp.]MCR5177130.1 peptidoglycan DD-metalloendopeptidase family protein [Anaerovibrio sp.]